MAGDPLLGGHARRTMADARPRGNCPTRALVASRDAAAAHGGYDLGRGRRVCRHGNRILRPRISWRSARGAHVLASAAGCAAGARIGPLCARAQVPRGCQSALLHPLSTAVQRARHHGRVHSVTVANLRPPDVVRHRGGRTDCGADRGAAPARDRVGHEHGRERCAEPVCASAARGRRRAVPARRFAAHRRVAIADHACRCAAAASGRHGGVGWNARDDAQSATARATRWRTCGVCAVRQRAEVDRARLVDTPAIARCVVVGLVAVGDPGPGAWTRPVASPSRGSTRPARVGQEALGRLCGDCALLSVLHADPDH